MGHASGKRRRPGSRFGPWAARAAVALLSASVPATSVAAGAASANGAFWQDRATVRPPARALAVLVSFAGVSQAQAPADARLRLLRRLFGPGPESLRADLLANSYGRFDLEGDVVGGAAAGQAGAWLVLRRPGAYYAAGGGGLGRTAPNGRTLAAAVIGALDRHGFDWRPYETAGARVPYLILVTAGSDGAASGDPHRLWSTEWPRQHLAFADAVSGQGSVVSFALCAAGGVVPGQLGALGTEAHEFGHLLGLPDLYDTAGAGAGLGDWSLMAAGAWLGPDEDASRPSAMDAFSRIWLGWIRPRTVAVDDSFVLAPIERRAEAAVVLPGGPYAYVLEDRAGALAGADSMLPACGLVVYRVDVAVMRASSPWWRLDRVDASSGAATPPGPGVTLVEADGSRALQRRHGYVGGPGDVFAPGRNAQFASQGGGRAWRMDVVPAAKGLGIRVRFVHSQARGRGHGR